MPSKRRKRRFSVIGFFKLTRFPNLIIIGFTQYFTAMFLAPHPISQPARFFHLDLFLLSSSTILIAAAGYIINDYYDVKIDYVNKPQRVVVGRLIRRRIVLASHLVLSLTGIALGFYLNLSVGVLNLFAVFILWLYSNLLKRMPLIGNFTIALLAGLSLTVVALYYQSNAYLIMHYAFFAFALSLVREIIKDMEDLKGDQRFGSKTLPIIWGIRRTKNFLYFLIGLFVILFAFMTIQLQNSTLSLFFLLLLPPILYFILLLYRADTQHRFLILSNYCKIFMLVGVFSMIFF